ncbi:MAG: hypothetical protein HQL48_07575 [Gammaproteobacteria bacterium]|nr:hypothetical protein [Gammaproteobacteria bacterium]
MKTVITLPPLRYWLLLLPLLLTSCATLQSEGKAPPADGEKPGKAATPVIEEGEKQSAEPPPRQRCHP